MRWSSNVRCFRDLWIVPVFQIGCANIRQRTSNGICDRLTITDLLTYQRWAYFLHFSMFLISISNFSTGSLCCTMRQHDADIPNYSTPWLQINQMSHCCFINVKIIYFSFLALFVRKLREKIQRFKLIVNLPHAD